MRTLHGVAAAPGIAVGPARRIEDPLSQIEERRVPPSRVEEEIERFRAALSRAREELLALREATREDVDEESARIFDVQLMVLEDPLAVDRTEEAIREEGKNAEFLFRRHVLEISERLEGLSDGYFSDRAVDLRDVKRRVLRHLSGGGEEPTRRRGVLVGRELAPSDAVHLDPRRVLGIATETGGRTSHVAIMARARGIPAVMGVKGLSEGVAEGETLAVDGFRGTVTVNPSPEVLSRFRDRQQAHRTLKRRQAKLKTVPAHTRDGHRVRLAANMEMPAELPMLLERGAEGIGLFRTEFFFMWSRRAPTEDEQVGVYREILEAMGEAEVVIRVLDLGGEKTASYLGIPGERNPFMGMRGVRFLLHHPDLFQAQLRAILRAGVGGRARILFPMVSSVEEFEALRTMVQKAAASLRRRRVSFDEGPSLGVMIEVPSAVWMAEELAARADFLSVGSNDLIQYLLAIDRDNQDLLHLYQPHHPAVLRAFRTAVEAAHRHGKRISICGEMAGDPLSVPFLVGLGFDELSVSSSLLPTVKQTLLSLDLGDCRSLVEDALGCSESGEVNRLAAQRLGTRFSDLLAQVQNTNGAKPRRESRSRARGRRTRGGSA